MSVCRPIASVVARVLAGATVLLVVVGIPATIGSANASALVPVTLTVRAPDGSGISGVPFQMVSAADGVSYADRGKTRSDGVLRFDAIANSTARVFLDDAGVHFSAGGSAIDARGGRLVSVDTGQEGLELPVGTDPVRRSVTFPALETKTFRVVTESGQPVQDAAISVEARVSVPFADDLGRTYRVRTTSSSIGTYTNTAGWVKLTTWEYEPDPAAAAVGDYSRDGQPDSLGVRYNITPTASVMRWIPYTDWATNDNVNIVLPYVPTVTDTSSIPGATVGEADVNAVLVQPTSSGTTTPIAGEKVNLYKQRSVTSARTLVATALTNARGKVTFAINLDSPTRLTVGSFDSHVAGVTMARPRLGVGFARIQYDAPGTDTTRRRSLNAEWFVLKNYSRQARRLTGLTVRDSSGDRYGFGSITLLAGRSIKVHTGSGTNSRSDRFRALNRHTLGNRADTMTLRAASGALVDQCAWRRRGNGHQEC